MKVIAYVKTGCPWCRGVTDYFKEKGIEFEEKNVFDNPQYFEEMKSISGQTKAPVVIIDDHVLADTDKDAVDSYLNAST